MKFCEKCGKEIHDDAVICIGCGCMVSGEHTDLNSINNNVANKSNQLKLFAKVFAIIGTVASGFYIIPLFWMIPMTIILSNKIKNNQPIGMGFKVCILLFVSIISGIFLLCDDEG